MKNSKRSYIIIALVVLVLAVGVGYALFSTNLKIEGTATANGSWKVYFSAATATPGAGSTATGTASISTTTKTSDTVTVAIELKQPGDSVTVSTTIKNDGSHVAKLNGLTLKAADGESATLTTSQSSHTYGAIQAVLNASNVADNSTIAANGGTATYTLTFTWPAAYTTEEVDDTLGFEITLPYEQNV